MAKTDKKTLDLLKKVNEQKEEISKAGGATAFKTNCTFSYVEGKENESFSLHSQSIQSLIQIAAFLKEKEEFYNRAIAALNVKDVPPFSWKGQPVENWLHDIKVDIEKLQLSVRKKQLAEMEARLNAILSPEKRAELELELLEGLIG
jgi:hypothetical protein